MKAINKFFLGIRLPQPLETECEKWRRRFKAPRTIAHLTLIAPFIWAKETTELSKLLKEGLRGTESFQIKGKGLGSFGTRVIFLNVEPSPELIAAQKLLTSLLAEADVALEKRPYHPHITLATRLDRKRFHDYKKQLTGLEPAYSFLCEEISLFALQEGRYWQEQERLPLSI